MKKSIFSAIMLTYSFGFQTINCCAQPFTGIWAHNSNIISTYDRANAITADTSGIYVAGLDFDLGNNAQWRIEKRDLTTGALISTFGIGGMVTSNPSSLWDAITAITADASGIYMAGYDAIPGNNEWRIEKRDLTTGALIASFGTGGIVTENPTIGNYDCANAIIADASGIYVAGWNEESNTNQEWRIEKRDLTTGALIASFGTGGVVISNPTLRHDAAYAITADASGIYVAGKESYSSDAKWRIEKRDLTTGALIASFGTGGVITSNPSTNDEWATAITADASGIYVAGSDGIPGNYINELRIEKRDLTTGALIASFGTGGVVTGSPKSGATAITADASGIYVAGGDYISGNWEWHIQKYDLTTGVLLCTQTSNPSSGDDLAYAITIDASGIYVAGTINPYWGNSKWRIEKYDLCGTNLPCNYKPTVTANASATTICAGTSITLTGGGASTYTWSGGVTNGVGFIPSGTSQYTVTGTDGNGCSNTATKTITVNPLPTVTLQPFNPDTVCITAGTFTLANGSPANGIYSGKGVSGGMFNPSVAGAGTNTITYTYTDSNGCTDSSSQTIYVDVCTGVQLFSENQSVTIFPNPTTGQIQVFSNQNSLIGIEIYNVLGEKVFAMDKERRLIAIKSLTIDLSPNPNGIYFIHLQTDNENIVKKLIINK